MVKKIIILLVLYFFVDLPYEFAGKRIFCQGAGAGGSRSRSKKKQEPEPLGKKIRSRSRLKKSQEPEPLKNLPAPQPCLSPICNRKVWKTGLQPVLPA